jgi:lysophospholipase L1-like esterase|tara:strand:+ start:230 stop:787 length:558 start_codon:yes stop_codon:yes gene_type:complete
LIWNEIVCLGDSITYGARDEYDRSPTIELSKIMKEKTGEIYICHNYGISGETSVHLLKRTWGACSAHKAAKIAFLMIGTNDTQKATPLEIYEDNLRQIIDICRIHGLHIIISTLPKLGLTPLYFKNSNLIKVYNDVIMKLSVELNLDICDMSGVEEHYVDGVHFTNAGHKEIANRWANKIMTSQT